MLISASNLSTITMQALQRSQCVNIKFASCRQSLVSNVTRPHAPLSTVPARPLAGKAYTQRRLQLSVTARFSSSSSNNRSFSPSVLERVISCVPYLLPFFDAFMYGIYLFRMFPVMRMCMAPILPALSLYHSTPFAAFIAFFAV